MSEEQGNDFWLDDELKGRFAEPKPQADKSQHFDEQVRPKDYRNRLYSETTKDTKKNTDQLSVNININLNAAWLEKTGQLIKNKASTLWHQILTLPNLFRRLSKRTKVATISIVAVVAIVFIGLQLAPFGRSNNPQKTTDPTAVLSKNDSGPSFAPLVPQDNANKPLGANQDYRYLSDRKLVVYKAKWADAHMVISQQQIPENIKDNPSILKNAALSIGAKRSISSKKGTVYIADSANKVAQNLVFMTDSVLVFVRSDYTLEDAAWADYVNLLTSAKN